MGTKLRAIAAIAALMTSGSVAAQVADSVPRDQQAPQRFDFAIPAGSTRNVLASIADTAGRRIDVRSSALNGRRSEAVRGWMTLEQALALALKGLGLEATPSENGTFRIASEGEGGDIVVIGAAPATKAVTSMRSSLSIAETPQGVQVLGKELLASRQAVQVEDVLRFSSGVTIDTSQGGQHTAVLRGFEAPTITDGFANAGPNRLAGSGLGLPAIAVGQIEVVKGADSILAGQMQPGGVIDVVRKKPETKPGLAMSLQGGSYGEYIVSADATGRLFNSDVLAYRLIGSSRYDVDSYFGFKGLRQRYFAPSLALRKGAIDLVVGYERNDQRQAPPAFTFINSQGIVPYTRLLGAPSDATNLGSSNIYGEMYLNIARNLIFHSKVQNTLSTLENNYHLAVFSNIADIETGNIADLQAFSNYRSLQTSTDSNLSWTVAAAGIKNMVMIGAGTQRGHSRLYSARPELQSGNYNTLVFAPLPTLSTSNIPKFESRSTSSQIYFKDELSAGPVVVVGSVTRAETTTVSLISIPIGPTPIIINRPTESADAWLPSVGVTLKLNKWLSIYGTYLRSFNPQGGYILGDGTPASPSQGKAYEGGMKISLANGKALATAAYFKSSATNVIYFDTNNQFAINPAGNSSSGVEADLRGQITRDLYVSASYTYAKVTQNSKSIDFTAYLSGVPAHTYSIWANQRVARLGEGSLSLSGGVTGRSSYQSSDGQNPSFRPYVPGQHSFDASISYDNRGFSVVAGVKNLTDRRLYANYADVTLLGVLPGRTFALTVSNKF